LPLLLANGADVHVITRAATPAVEATSGITLELRDYRDGDLDGAWYAIAATDDPAVNAAVVAEAERSRIFCVRADVARDGTAVTPASFEYDGLSVGVLAGGEHRRSAAIRTAIREALQSGIISDEVPDALRGAVALVGGGPGDPELITVRGRRLLAQADVVVADRLAPPELLAELAPHVEMIDASKIPYGRAMAQDAINDVLIDRARAGKFVVRLKGGDPFVFARGYEEVIACAGSGHPGHRRTWCDECHSRTRIGGCSGHSQGRHPRVRGGQRPCRARSSRIVSELECAGRAVRHDRAADGGRAHRIVRQGPAGRRPTCGNARPGGPARHHRRAADAAHYACRRARADPRRGHSTSGDHRDRGGGGVRQLKGS
jgi:siroheme synthase (precorrin-2 oxidase/ferrochelatase)